jgi:hypothetical protein
VSDTPRTDAAAIRCACSSYVVPSQFARELERENAALRADKERLDSGRILLRCHDCFQGWQSVEFIGQDLRAAIDAAMKEAQP